MRKREGQFGEFYGCSNYPRCSHTAAVGKDGELVEKEPEYVREARQRAHKTFDKLWKPRNRHHRKHNGPLFGSRGAAYAWLANMMGVDRDHAHIKQFSADQCEKVIYEARMLLYDGFRMSNSGMRENLFGGEGVAPLELRRTVEAKWVISLTKICCSITIC